MCYRKWGMNTMKKSRIMAAAMASIAMTGALGSCSYSPHENVEPDVYGPPESYEEPVEEPESADEPESTDDYEAEMNIEPGVYGPPGSF